ncbi:wax ester/triacylglycerol synthase family O-acyltransferase [Novosphingobium sp. Gsoil 351]|uniref:wax ester/triacylglycerol synthase family O-acyltransferase n=1 Tax=Novosphingobium sp. Gsoil 351 TaxID=2675225 RepID=UPI0012B4BF51|nr:wax ester/triacylglycerol synthase family O-acyltransferase [Novosphingobium sp. Gsoil 351]QGN54219.1 wax ester/triacylglycerol synthase family O-acyltransferase [Novosphingobium sp. Gsoil 351]
MAELHQLTSSDAAMLFLETPDTPNHIAPLIICDQSTVPGGTTLRLRQIKAKMERALDGAPNFRRRLVRPPLDIDNPYWVDDPNFDLDFHLRHLALPEPGDWRQLSIQVARLLSRSLDPNRPLWEMYVIEGLDRVVDLPPGAFAVLLKIHHAMMDGMGAMSLMDGMFDRSPLQPPEPSAAKWRPQPGPHMTEIISRGWLNAGLRFSKIGVRLNALAAKAVRERLSGPTEESPIPANAVPKTPFNGPLTPARVYDLKQYPLKRIKSLRSLVPGSTVNDVGLALITGALRRYLIGRNALPADNLICAVPVSIRSEASRNKPAGNEISAIYTPIPTGTEDPLERLRLIAAQMAQQKVLDRALSARSLVDLTSELPGTMGGLISRGMTAIGDRRGRALIANTLVTNVPGMSAPMYFCGARIVNIVGGGPCVTNMGLIHLIGSYCDLFNINVVGCRDLVPDIGFYMECVEDSVAEYFDLYAALVGHDVTSSPVSRRTKKKAL